MLSKSYGCAEGTKLKVAPKWPGNANCELLQLFPKNVEEIERKFLQSFHTILVSHVSNGITILCLWSDKQPKLAPNWPKKPILNIKQFSQIPLLTSSYASLVLRFYVILFSLISFCMIWLIQLPLEKLCHSCDFHLGLDNSLGKF